MSYKKQFIILSIIWCIFLFSSIAHAEIINEVLSTDIGTVMDGVAIKSYNIEDHIYICAEDLRGYGFDVIWTPEKRSLQILRNLSAPRTLLPAADVNIEKKDIVSGEKIYDVYSTDIKVYLDQQEIKSAAINGRMLIPVTALKTHAYVEYNETRRLVDIKAMTFFIDREIEKLEYPHTIVTTDPQDETAVSTYIGELTNGLPGNIGKTITKKLDMEGQIHYDYNGHKIIRNNTAEVTVTNYTFHYMDNTINIEIKLEENIKTFTTGRFVYFAKTPCEIYNIVSSQGDTLFSVNKAFKGASMPTEKFNIKNSTTIQQGYTDTNDTNKTYLYGYYIETETDVS